MAFHAVGIALHVANALLCFLLVQRLARRRTVALLASLVFALHPLQVESVAWISELRGSTSSLFALIALNALVLSRQASARASIVSGALFVASALFVTCAMLCKPAAVALPLVALAIDRIVLATSWRKAIEAVSIWAACVLPFAWITRSIQAVATSGESLWWQRPFIAGDALAFYVLKTLVPIDLCVDYGRTPRLVMSHAWGYLAWAVPAGLLVLCYWKRQQRPLTWLGALMFATFLLPTLGLVPFSFQAYSTVADRYAYLALVGVGLVIADAVDYLGPKKIVVGVLSVALAFLAMLSFDQSQHWVGTSNLLRHTLDVNPDAAFAYNNLGDREQANGEYAAALADYRACVEHDPTRLKAYINMAEVYSVLKQPAEAERALAQAAGVPGLVAEGVTADDFSNLGIVLMKLHQVDRALWALAKAVAADPAPRCTSITRPMPFPRLVSSTRLRQPSGIASRLPPPWPAPTPGSASCSPRPTALPKPWTSFVPRFTCNPTIPPRSTI